MSNTTQNLIGDKGVADSTLYKVPITIEDAKQLANSLLTELNVPAQVKVRYGRKTRKRYGTIRKTAMENGRHDFIIQLNSLGLNVGTVLHELAHIDRKGELVEGHPDRFRKGLELYTGMFKKLFPVPDMVADAMETGADWPESVFPQKTIGAECQSQKFPEDLVEALCNILLGERIPLDIINSETGEVIIPANYKITKTYLRIMAAHVDHVEMCPSPIRIKILRIIDNFRGAL